MLANDKTPLPEPVTGWRGWRGSLLAVSCVFVGVRIGFFAHASQPNFGSGVAVGRVEDGHRPIRLWPKGRENGHGYGGSANQKHVTSYFRTTFNVVDPAALASLQLTVLFDDGVAVYLNGAEVLRQHLNANAGYAGLASADNSQFENVWSSYPLSPATVRPGRNTLAVEVHRRSRSEADLSFDLQLTSVPAELVPVQPPPRFTGPPVLEGNSWRLVFSGPPGSTVNVECSSDPSAAGWQNLGWARETRETPGRMANAMGNLGSMRWKEVIEVFNHGWTRIRTEILHQGLAHQRVGSGNGGKIHYSLLPSVLSGNPWLDPRPVTCSAAGRQSPSPRNCG